MNITRENNYIYRALDDTRGLYTVWSAPYDMGHRHIISTHSTLSEAAARCSAEARNRSAYSHVVIATPDGMVGTPHGYRDGKCVSLAGHVPGCEDIEEAARVIASQAA